MNAFKVIGKKYCPPMLGGSAPGGIYPGGKGVVGSRLGGVDPGGMYPPSPAGPLGVPGDPPGK